MKTIIKNIIEAFSSVKTAFVSKEMQIMWNTIKKYNETNAKRLAAYKKHKAPTGFAEKAFPKEIEIDLLSLQNLKTTIIYRSEAKAAFAEILQEEIDDTQLIPARFSAKYFNIYSNYYYCWLYKGTYFIRPGFFSDFGYINPEHFIIEPISFHHCSEMRIIMALNEEEWFRYKCICDYITVIAKVNDEQEIVPYKLESVPLRSSGEVIKFYQDKAPTVEEIINDVKTFQRAGETKRC